ncbi:MAG: glutamyl-tRNA reductase [Firmicutes bacterium HGW-Firmicutes-14]|nr:MAG: glutamyl-tRNA reductase [Firmicutes bacterium HGW-Firmicutes-14]
MFLVTVGLNHRTAPVEIREKLSFAEDSLPKHLNKLTANNIIRGCVILSTCNRTEVYAAVIDVDKGLTRIREHLAKCCRKDLNELKNYLYTYTLFDVIPHLFRVASGLDSMILGETQVLGQVRTAYQIACENGSTNRVLNTLFQQAITVGKKVRTDTLIDRNAVSISYAAVELARQIFEGDLDGKSILVIGAGKMSELTAKHLVANGVTSVLVSNRSIDKARVLAEQFGGRAVRFDELHDCMVRADIVISATAAAHCIIEKPDMEKVMDRRGGRKIFIIDIAVPRDVDPLAGEVPGVSLYDIDELQYVVDKNLEHRKKESLKAEKIIQAEIDEFWKWLSTQFVTPTIAALKKRGEEIRQKEMKKAYNRLGNITEREKKIISSMTNSIVNQLLHDPVMQLKNYALTRQGHLYTEILQNLFNLDVPNEKRFAAGKDNNSEIDGHPTGHPGGHPGGLSAGHPEEHPAQGRVAGGK